MDALEPLIRAYVKGLFEQIDADLKAFFTKYPDVGYNDVEVVFQKTSEGEVYRGLIYAETMVVDHHPDWPLVADEPDEPTS